MGVRKWIADRHSLGSSSRRLPLRWAVRKTGIEPVVANHRQQHVALVDFVPDVLAKTQAEGKGADVQDDVLFRC